MKKTITISTIFVVVFAFIFLVYPYKIKRVCLGDLCPQNGGLYLLYSSTYTKEQCLEKGAYPVEGIGWGPIYAGCSPISGMLSK